MNEYNINQQKLNFNSIKVQLEPADYPIPELDSIFQFHKGAIRTQQPNVDVSDVPSFQFHKGAIRTKNAAY